jgi:hypothetical protein
LSISARAKLAARRSLTGPTPLWEGPRPARPEGLSTKGAALADLMAQLGNHRIGRRFRETR